MPGICAYSVNGYSIALILHRLETLARQLHVSLAQCLRYTAHLLAWDLAVLLPSSPLQAARYVPHRAAPVDRCVCGT